MILKHGKRVSALIERGSRVDLFIKLKYGRAACASTFQWGGLSPCTLDWDPFAFSLHISQSRRPHERQRKLYEGYQKAARIQSDKLEITKIKDICQIVAPMVCVADRAGGQPLNEKPHRAAAVDTMWHYSSHCVHTALCPLHYSDGAMEPQTWTITLPHFAKFTLFLESITNNWPKKITNNWSSHNL